jgi:protein-disulfide isomerase
MNKLRYIFLILLTLNIGELRAENIKPIIDGNSNSKIKILVYESLTCSYCADFHNDIFPELKKEFIDTGLISIEYKNFPLDMAALNASKLSHCKNDGNSELLHHLYLNQKKWAKGSTINEINSNLNTTIKEGNYKIDTKKCFANEVLEDHILNDRVEAVKKYDVNSTPTIIINEKKFEKPLTFKNLQKAIEKLL